MDSVLFLSTTATSIAITRNLLVARASDAIKLGHRLYSLGPRLSSRFSTLFHAASVDKLDEGLGPRLDCMYEPKTLQDHLKLLNAQLNKNVLKARITSECIQNGRSVCAAAMELAISDPPSLAPFSENMACHPIHIFGKFKIWSHYLLKYNI